MGGPSCKSVGLEPARARALGWKIGWVGNSAVEGSDPVPWNGLGFLYRPSTSEPVGRAACAGEKEWGVDGRRERNAVRQAAGMQQVVRVSGEATLTPNFTLKLPALLFTWIKLKV